jgi:ribosomal protein S21
LKLKVGIKEERNEALRRFKRCGDRVLIDDRWCNSFT